MKDFPDTDFFVEFERFDSEFFITIADNGFYLNLAEIIDSECYILA